jgi:lysophospholipase L1-like esterase
MTYRTRILAALIAVAALTGLATPAHAESKVAYLDAYAMYGDSHSVALSKALPAEGLTMASGYVHGGWTAPMLLTKAVKAPQGVRTLVLVAGTNDRRYNLQVWQTRKAFDQIVAKAGVPNVILVALPPKNDSAASTIVTWNTAYQKIAAVRGWTYVDPWSQWRNSRGGWVAGATTDGVHGTTAVYASAAHILADAIRASNSARRVLP